MFISFPSAKDPNWEEKYPGKDLKYFCKSVICTCHCPVSYMGRQICHTVAMKINKRMDTGKKWLFLS